MVTRLHNISYLCPLVFKAGFILWRCCLSILSMSFFRAELSVKDKVQHYLLRLIACYRCVTMAMATLCVHTAPVAVFVQLCHNASLNTSWCSQAHQITMRATSDQCVLAWSDDNKDTHHRYKDNWSYTKRNAWATPRGRVAIREWQCVSDKSAWVSDIAGLKGALCLKHNGESAQGV